MDEMTRLRRFGDELAGEETTPAPQTRARVLAGITKGGSGRGARVPRPRRSLMLATGGALVAASVVAGTAILGGSPGGPVPPSAGQPGEEIVDARTFLLAAAHTARTSGATAPDPDAFVYTRSKELGMSTTVGEDGDVRKQFSSEREAWLSVSGRRDGAVTPSGDDELVEIEGCPRDGMRIGDDPSCTADPAYRDDLPTDAEQMRAYLYSEAREEMEDFDAFEKARTLVVEQHVAPEALAAVFEAMATIPGVEIVQDATVLTDRRGVAVALTLPTYQEREEIVFDPRTYEAFGMRSVSAGDPDMADGTILFASEVLETGIVDEVTLRPDGTRRPGPIERNG